MAAGRAVRKMMNDTRRSKLRFRASRRGFREMDLYMEAFAVAHLDGMDDRQLDEFEAILDIPDQFVYDWILGRGDPPAEARSGTLDQLLSFPYASRVKDDNGSPG
jgi:antitoxin CptB